MRVLLKYHDISSCLSVSTLVFRVTESPSITDTLTPSAPDEPIEMNKPNKIIQQECAVKMFSTDHRDCEKSVWIHNVTCKKKNSRRNIDLHIHSSDKRTQASWMVLNIFMKVVSHIMVHILAAFPILTAKYYIHISHYEYYP